MLEIFSEAIKRVATPFSGVLTPHSHLSDEVLEMQEEIFSDLEMKKPSDDKMNLKRDGQNIRKDVKKAVRAYQSEFC